MKWNGPYKVYMIDTRAYNLDGCHVWVNANSWRDSKLKGLDCSKGGKQVNPRSQVIPNFETVFLNFTYPI